eukprot:TRINITY_DN702_c0_g1_i8.p2 TRINITY_DN702_c0_g1~~TRINITY_DN702_c0_g1_i8.p2  ORF type:complete len:123 (-),score=12.85 TRINITY_DN702_c0_g1_i8:539-907(-)
MYMISVYLFFFFFSSRRRHTRSCLVSWARRCVQETDLQAQLNLQYNNFYLEIEDFVDDENQVIEVYKNLVYQNYLIQLLHPIHPLVILYMNNQMIVLYINQMINIQNVLLGFPYDNYFYLNC